MSPRDLRELEDRLGDALETAARTVSDQAVRPEPQWSSTPPERHRRTWAVAVVAAAAVAAAVAVPALISDDARPGPASEDAVTCAPPPSAQQPVPTIPRQGMRSDQDAWATSLPFGPPPLVPYTLKAGLRSGGILQDGAARVPLPTGLRFFSWGQVECGWLGANVTGEEQVEIGVLETSGSFRSFGKALGDGASPSPDGRQAAFVRPAGESAELVVVDVATGRVVASTPTPPNSDVLGWNSHGVWFAPLREGAQTRLWRPGSEPVRIDTGGARLTAWRTQDRMLLTGGEPGQQVPGCLRVVVLEGGDRLTEVMRQCITPEGSLSPDGQVLVAGAHAFRVPDNTRTGYKPGSSSFGADHESIWEDDRHLLSQSGVYPNRLITVRCDVVEGNCERAADGPESPLLGLGYP